MFITIGLGVLALLLALLFLASYKKAKPDEALIITGLGKQKTIVGKAGFALPFLQRVDRLPLSLVQIDVKASNIPTSEFININIDAVANVQISDEKDMLATAAKNFLNRGRDYIEQTVREVLEGNTREIIGQMELKSLVNKRDEFALKVQENVTDDMARIGMKVINFTVQNFTDENGAIENLGVDNLAQIQKEAKIAKANASKEVAIAEAKAQEAANKARVDSAKLMSEQDRELAIAEAENKAAQDTERAKAEAAFAIQEQLQKKEINKNQVDAETAKAERELELKERQIELKERELDANVKKQADADKYKIIQLAEADKQRRILEAEAEKEVELRKAEAIKAKGEAAAAAIRAQKLAEAEGIAKLADAQKKMGEASIVEMVMDKLPEIATALAKPLEKVSNITMYDPNGTTKLLENTTAGIDQVFKAAEAGGVDLKGLISGYIGGKVAKK